MLNFTDSEMRSFAKDKIESLEYWLRRLIDNELTKSYGNFFVYEDSNGNRLFRKSISDSVATRVAGEPDRYPREIDAILLDDAIDIICHPSLYSKHFKEALEYAFPLGREEARCFLKRLSDPRNRLAHVNPISLRQFEQVVCYVNDIIESLKKYYGAKNMSEEFDVPLILKTIDSFGNGFHREQFIKIAGGAIQKDLTEEPKNFLRPGDSFTLEVEVDPSFSDSEYDVIWKLRSGVGYSNPVPNKIVIDIIDECVSLMFLIECEIKSNKSWHRYSDGRDDFLRYFIKVLPPV